VTAQRAALLLAAAMLSVGVAAGQATQTEGTIDPAGIVAEQGHCYTVAVSAPIKPDTPAAARASCLRLFEDDRELGPGHSGHQAIRDTGRGRFSHWSGNPDGEPQILYFSASDNSDPRENGRAYRWVVDFDADGRPIEPEWGVLSPEPCRLSALPAEPPGRDRHTTLLAHFDESDTSDAAYARNGVIEVGVGGDPDSPGKFGGGVSVTGANGAVMFPALDNYDPLKGTVEFWAQSRAEEPVWRDAREHWLLVLYPERGGASPRYGMAPTFLGLSKSARNTLDFTVAQQGMAHYSVGVGLRNPEHPTLRVPVGDLAPDGWHHVLLSWDLRGSGRMWLTVNGEGVTADMGRPADAVPPNPGMFVVLGGLWGLPGDDVRTSDCNLDELHVSAATVAARLEGAERLPDREIDEARLLEEVDLSRAVLDKLLELQSHGGWAADYNWPTYTPSGWSFVGRGVDMWFVNSAWAANALMRGWLIWRDERYLDGAIEAADMFCETQMENGTWSYHYTYSRGEFVPWGASAYIAQSMQSNQIRFLCMMYRLLGYERYEQAIRKAGDWMVSIQFPSGAWGW
jgi:hypothetical protein